MTRQESFNHICRNLIAAESPSIHRDDESKESRCVYRGYFGARCAVGWLIPDYLYTRDIEGAGISKVVEVLPLLKDEPLFNCWTLDELSALQQVHDHAALKGTHKRKWSEVIRDDLRQFAKDYNLKMEV